MHCWFCESPLRAGGPGQVYCPLAACPACKALVPAYAVLDGEPTLHWQAKVKSGIDIAATFEDATGPQAYRLKTTGETVYCLRGEWAETTVRIVSTPGSEDYVVVDEGDVEIIPDPD